MLMRTLAALAVLVLGLGACSSDSPAKDLAADVAVVRDGPVADRPAIYPDRPAREAQAGDQSPADQPAPDGVTPVDAVTPDKAKPAAFCMTMALRCDCYGYSKKLLKYVPLWGKATKFTTGMPGTPDFKVKEVGVMQGKLKVKQMIAGIATKCGEWVTVPSGADFTYQVVTSGEDFTIEYNTFNQPGINNIQCPLCP
jgi:hypothetical protein